MFCRHRRALTVSALALLAIPSLSSADVLHWTGAAGDALWSNANNWSPTRVPTYADDVVCTLSPLAGEIQVKNNAGCNSISTTERVVLAGGSLYVGTTGTLSGGLLIYNPNGSYPILTNHGSITVDGTANFFAGAIRQIPGATIDFVGTCQTKMYSGGVSFEGGSITNDGVLEVLGTGFTLGNYYPTDPATVFVNSPSGTIRFSAAASIFDHSFTGNTGGTSTLLNEGNFQILAAGFNEIRPAISLWNYDSGFVDVSAGTLQVDNVTNIDSNGLLNGASWYVHDQGYLTFNRNLNGVAPNASVYIYNTGVFAGMTTAVNMQGNLYLGDGAHLTIAQTIYGALNNSGFIFVAPGSQLTTTGSYIQSPTGTLRRAIQDASGLTTPAVISQDRPILNGTLIVDFWDPNLITPGTQFPIVSGSCCTTGSFGTLQVLPDNSSKSVMNYDNGQAILRVPAPCTGDINHDGVVNTFDLGILLGHFGVSVNPGDFGDLDGNGLVNSFDLGAFLSHFGNTCP